MAMKGMTHPAVLKDAVVGILQQVSRDYYMTCGIIASWTLPNDVNAVTSGMFNGMNQSPIRNDEYIVLMVVEGLIRRKRRQIYLTLFLTILLGIN
jgi:hypothetical protein